MRVFVTGATGFIGSVVVQDLIKARAHGARPGPFRQGCRVACCRRGRGAPGRSRGSGQPAQRRGVSGRGDPLGFIHDFSRFQEVCEADRRAIVAIGDALAGSDRPLVVTSGTGMGTAVPGQPSTEDHFDAKHPNPRAGSEIAAEAVAGRGVRVTVVRLPQVHNTEKQGLVTSAIAIAREKGVSAYVGDGLNRWPAVHVLDAAPSTGWRLKRGRTGHSRGRGRGRASPRDRGSHRPGLEDSRRLRVPSRGRRPLRLDGVLRWARHAGVERATQRGWDGTRPRRPG